MLRRIHTHLRKQVESNAAEHELHGVKNTRFLSGRNSASPMLPRSFVGLLSGLGPVAAILLIARALARDDADRANKARLLFLLLLMMMLRLLVFLPPPPPPPPPPCNLQYVVL